MYHSYELVSVYLLLAVGNDDALIAAAVVVDVVAVVLSLIKDS